MASYISATLASLTRKGEQFVSSALAHASNVKTQIIEAPLLFHDKGSEIDELRDYLGYLNTPQKKFAHKDDRHTPLLKERASLTDFLNRAKSIVDNHKELFNLDFSKPKYKNHEKPFTALITQLEKEIAHLEAHPAEKSKELYPETLEAVNTALSKLHQLKALQAGILTSDARLAEAAPELQQCTDHLIAVQKAIFTGNSQKIVDAFTPLNSCIDTLLKQKEILFYEPELTDKDASAFKELQNLFRNYQNLPDSLKQDGRFHPNDAELMAGIKKTAATLDPYIKSKQTAIKKMIKTIITSGTQFAKDNLPSFNDSSTPHIHYSPFQILNDAISFFIGVGKGYDTAYKKDLILTLSKECNESHADFESHFLNAIAKTNPEKGPLSHAFARQHLLDYPQALEAAFKAALKETAASLGFTEARPTKATLLAFVNSKEVTAPTNTQETRGASQSEHPLLTYAKETLGLLRGSSSIKASALSIAGHCFLSLLNGDAFTGWIATQKPETRGVLTDIKNKTLVALNAAIGTNTLKDYIAAYEKFIELLSGSIVSVDGIVLNPLFQDKATTKAQLEATEKLDKTMNQLRRDFESGKIKENPDFKWDGSNECDKKIEAQIKDFSDNLQDQLTYQFIYETLLGKKVPNSPDFYRIKKLQKDKPIEKRKEIFIEGLKKAIDLSDASWLGKMTTKFIVSIAHRWIGFYSNNIISKFYKDLDKHLGKIDKPDLFTRATNCFSKYNGLLKAWAHYEEGSAKTPFIDTFMKTKKFLSYGESAEESYTQDELYNTVSDTFIENYFDLYKGDNDEDISATHYLNSSLTKINHFILERPFYAGRNPLLSSLNYLAVGIKAVLIGIPSFVVIKVATLPIAIFEGAANRLMKFIFRKGLEKFKTIDSVIKSTREGVHENNPYVPAITSFLADQLESLSQELSSENQDQIEAGAPEASKEQKAAAEKTRAMLKKATDSLLEILNKNEYSTPDQLKAYIHEKGLVTVIKDNLETLVLPLLVESIIDITSITSNKLLNKKALQQPISLLLDKLNGILTEAPEVQDQEKLALEELKNQAAQEKLDKYTEKLIDQVITKAIDDAFQQSGQTQIKLVNDTTAWVQNETPEFLKKCRDLLEEIDPTDVKESHKNLEKLHNLANTFHAQLSVKRELLKTHSSTTAAKLSQVLLEIATPLETLLKGRDTTSGIFSLYNNYQILFKTMEDLPYLTACERAYESLNQDLKTLDTTFTDDHVTTRIFANSNCIKTILSRIRSKELTFLRESDEYTQLNDFLKSNDKTMKDRESAEIFIKETSLPMLKALNHLTEGVDLFTTLTTQKQAQLTRSTGILSSLRNPADPFIKTYKELSEKINKIPSEKIKKELTALLNEIYQAKSAPTITSSIRKFKEALEAAITLEKDHLQRKTNAILAIDEQFYDEIHGICERFKTTIEERTENNTTLLPGIDEAIETIEESAAHLNTISFIPIKTGASNLLKGVPYQVVYQSIQPKIRGVFKLLKDGSFSQFFANHVLLMPFVKK